jgi:hypothetical protein
VLVTNLTGLPEPLYRALADKYTRGDSDISATGLLEPPRKAALELQYADQLSEDVADLGAVLIGNAVHAYVKGEGELDDNLRLTMDVLGWTVSGQTDHVYIEDAGSEELIHLDGHTIVDWKSTKVSEWKHGLRVSREQQINIYAALLRANGYHVTAGKAVLIFRDWSDPAQVYDKLYPPHSITSVDVPIWEPEEAMAFIEQRVSYHQQARVELPECTPYETMGEDRWAVMKEGATRATRILDNQEDAIALADEKGSGYYVEQRFGEPLRCRYWCAVGKLGLCSQYELAKLNDGVN